MVRFKFSNKQHDIDFWLFIDCEQHEILPFLSTKQNPVTAESILIAESDVGKTHEFKPGNFFIWLYYPLTDPYSLSCLAHEIFHATFRAMQYINTPLSDDTEEIYAYMVDWLTKEILTRYNKKATKTIL